MALVVKARTIPTSAGLVAVPLVPLAAMAHPVGMPITVLVAVPLAAARQTPMPTVSQEPRQPPVSRVTCRGQARNSLAALREQRTITETVAASPAAFPNVGLVPLAATPMMLPLAPEAMAGSLAALPAVVVHQ